LLHGAALENPFAPGLDQRRPFRRHLLRYATVDSNGRIYRRFRDSATGLEMVAPARRAGTRVEAGTGGCIAGATCWSGAVAGGCLSPVSRAGSFGNTQRHSAAVRLGSLAPKDH